MEKNEFNKKIIYNNTSYNVKLSLLNNDHYKIEVNGWLSDKYILKDDLSHILNIKYKIKSAIVLYSSRKTSLKLFEEWDGGLD